MWWGFLYFRLGLGFNSDADLASLYPGTVYSLALSPSLPFHVVYYHRGIIFPLHLCVDLQSTKLCTGIALGY